MHGGGKNWGRGYKRRDGVLALTYIISTSLKWETVKILWVSPFDEHLFDPSFLHFLPQSPCSVFPFSTPS